MRKPIDLEAWAKKNAKYILKNGLLNSDPNDDGIVNAVGVVVRHRSVPKGLS